MIPQPTGDISTDNLVCLKQDTTEASAPAHDFIPITSVIGNYCSQRTFYDRVNAGAFTLYKFGRKSFVKKSEFFDAFIPVAAKPHKTKLT